MKSYLDLMSDIIENGIIKEDRTGTGTISVFGRQLRFNMDDGFPLLTTKKLHFKSIVTELMWFLNGYTDVKWLKDKGCSIWDEWTLEDGTIGKGYGYQWRNWNGIDQIEDALWKIKNNPDSRRIIVSAWNVDQLKDMALPPCHMMFQFYVDETRNRLNLMMYQRSCDVFLGCPYNIASYALLLHIFAKECDLIPGELIMSLGDTHLYSNHIDQAMLQLGRAPKKLPQVTFEKLSSIYNYRYENFEILDYDPHPHIKADVAV